MHTILCFMVKTVKQIKATTIVLQPNRSASWRQTKVFILIVSAFVALIALGWASLGAWIVLPFAGLEIGILSYLMYRVCYKSYQQQVITINPETITVEQGVYKPIEKCKLNAPLTHLTVVEAENEFCVTQLNLEDDRQSVPVGRFLNHHDANLARNSLQQAGLRVCSNQWWKY